MSKKKKPIPKSKKPLDKNLFSGLGESSLLNNSYKPSNNFSLASNLTSNFNFTTPQVGSPMGGSNPFGLSSLGNTNTVTGEAVGNAAKASSGINAGAVIQGIQGTVETAKAIADIGKMNDYSDFTNSLDNERNQLNALSNTAYSANNTSDLLSIINNANQAANDIQQTEDITLGSLTGTKAENDKKTLGAVGKGAAAGAAIGSIFPGAGTLIGAAVGAGIAGVGSGIANTFKQFKANKKLEELEEQKAEVDKQRKLALAQQQANLQVAANNLQINQANDIMTNYAALGGYLNMNTYNNGGPLFNEFNNGITIINEGGTHEFIIGQEYDVTDEEIKLLKKLGYEFEYI